jgi:hypothetical protein
MSEVVFDKALTGPDVVVLRRLAQDIQDDAQGKKESASDVIVEANAQEPSAALDREAVKALTARNDPADPQFLPTVFNSFDIETLQLPKWVDAQILRPYIRLAQSIVRVKSDVVMLNHLLLYLFTSVPSAAILFYHFTLPHAIAHIIMQFTYMGSYTLMMHQHIHGRGILAKRFSILDTCFPYLLDPLMGHTWNGYYYHHVKHHHVEGNGPNDLSSTIRFQRDDPLHFLYYLGRFFFLVWLDLPLYFARKGRYVLGCKAAFWEFATLGFIASLYRYNPSATNVVYLAPLLLLRIGLMIGNWGQHAFVDHDEPDSDYRSSVTLIDVAVSPCPTSCHISSLVQTDINRATATASMTAITLLITLTHSDIGETTPYHS